MKQFVSLILLVFTASVNCITFESNSYRDVVVSIHPDVPSDHGQEIVDAIKVFVSQGSERLFVATQKYAFIKSVNILLPQSWGVFPEAIYSSEYFYEDGVIRVNTENPLYLDTPYTVQPGGCGDPGDFTHLTHEYLLNLNYSSTDFFGPPGKVFVHEWSKLRYGVFEEYGYPGDDQFPMFYYEETFVDGGVETNLAPNFCTDYPLNGRREDIYGGSCHFDPSTNLPDEYCIFVPSGDNSAVSSSYMAAPFLDSVDGFCQDTETKFHHDPDKPNKQNLMCNEQDTWTIISGHKDFQTQDFHPLDVDTPPATEFRVLQPQDGRYTLVLDRSKSMREHDRMTRLKQSSIKWVKYDIKDGSYLGITSFSSSASEQKPLTKIDSGSRGRLVAAINGLNANGGTCLGNGLMQGMDTLNGEDDSSSGGVIVFITDGEQECDGSWALDIDDPKVLNRVMKTKVRIITVAFGRSSDSKIENLARISGGKAYFVGDDSGLEDINNVFAACNTYQPAVPSGDVEIVIQAQSFKDVKTTINGNFIVDQTLGRDVKLQLDFIVSSMTSVDRVQIFDSDDTLLSDNGFDKNSDTTLIVSFDHLDMGSYEYKIVPKNSIPYIAMSISAKAAAGDQLPFRTRCWVSTGTEEVNASEKKLAVLAQVTQGERPVLNAKVEAYVEREGETHAIRLDLFDNGSGADNVASDGIYSRFFTKYNGVNGRYTLKCQVHGDEETGFITQREGAKRLPQANAHSRTYPRQPGDNVAFCCGSSTGDHVHLSPTGNFTRQADAPSFKVSNVPTGDKFPPQKVSDLSVKLNVSQVVITFTATGEDYDDGKASSYELRYNNNLTTLYENWDNATVVNENNTVSGSLEPEESGVTMTVGLNRTDFEKIGVHYYFAVIAFDHVDQPSPRSNIGRLYFPPPEEESGLSGGAIAGIVIGVLLVGFIVFAVVYLFVKSKTT